VEEEIRKMPILNDILDHKVLGREYRKGINEGKREGKREGKLEGKIEGKLEGKLEGKREGKLEGIQEGELTILRRLIRARFGDLPRWAEESLHSKSPIELESLSVRLLTAETLDELLG
jgi:hypothetical protein